MSNRKLIIVSNRLPVSVTRVDGELTFSKSSGGLATAMSSLKDIIPDQLWIGWPGIASDGLTSADKATIIRKLRASNCYPVFLTQRQVKRYYEGYANNTIWPLFHYFQSIAQYNDEYWESYKEVSEVFKKAVIRHADEASLIWVHDYHLMLLPQALREALPKSTIGFFLHIPFPSFEIFRLLPNRREIIEGLLGADLIGFHIYDYARHFMSSVLRLLGFDQHHGTITVNDRVVIVDAFPIGIDYQKYVKMLKDSVVIDELKQLDDFYGKCKVILSMDRLDYSKGIVNRLEAFEIFLKENPKYLKKVVLVLIAVPSRVNVESYKNLRDTIESKVGHINGAYSTVDWAPISYQFRDLPFEKIIALMAKSDIALITPIRDGMNLVAKEYVAAKQRRNGVLILSEMAGAIDELPEALQINPNNKRSIVNAIKTALKMPVAEQKLRLRLMQQRISDYSVQSWANDYINQLELAKSVQAKQYNKMLNSEDRRELAKEFQAAKKRLLYLDYDGTLRDFVSSPRPSQAAPSKKLLQLLWNLADIPNNKVCLVSGRPKEALELWFSGIPITLVAEHGAWIKEKNTWTTSKVDTDTEKRKILPLLERYAERTPGARIEEKTYSLVWHYRNVPPDLAYVRNLNLRHELNQLLANTEMDIFTGNKIIEIKPHLIRKGRIVNEILRKNPSDFVMAIGDDYTDEDMFAALPETVHTIKVGLGETNARSQISSVEKVHNLLQAFVESTSEE